MSDCQLIVCEKTGHWAAALRQALAGRPPVVLETRSVSQAQVALALSPASVVALEATGHSQAAALHFLVSIGRQYPATRCAVLMTDHDEPAELLLREAGAIDALISVLDCPRFAKLARRHYSSIPAAEPLTARTWAAERLPWSAAATPAWSST